MRRLVLPSLVLALLCLSTTAWADTPVECRNMWETQKADVDGPVLSVTDLGPEKAGKGRYRIVVRDRFTGCRVGDNTDSVCRPARRNCGRFVWPLDRRCQRRRQRLSLRGQTPLGLPVAAWSTTIARMATLFLLCGLPGSGKTTLAREIERDHAALRLAPDEWMSRIVRDGWDSERRAVVDAIQTEIALRVVALGVNVVFESAPWRRRDRDELRARAAAIGASVKLHYLKASREELIRRLEARNTNLPPHTFAVDAQQLIEMESWFEAPTPDEL